MKSVLFVCTANICRSPIAMALWQDIVKSDPENWRVESAGTWASEEQPAAGKAQAVMEAWGLSLGFHSSRSVTRQMLRQFNLILTMERGQKEALQIEFSEIGKRVYLLTEMVGLVYDIHDPIGGSLAAFQATADEIKDILERGAARISQLASK